MLFVFVEILDVFFFISSIIFRKTRFIWRQITWISINQARILVWHQYGHIYIILSSIRFELVWLQMLVEIDFFRYVRLVNIKYQTTWIFSWSGSFQLIFLLFLGVIFLIFIFKSFILFRGFNCFVCRKLSMTVICQCWGILRVNMFFIKKILSHLMIFFP